jgi:hypothetical protein
MAKFSEGDRVVVIGIQSDNRYIVGWEGTVKYCFSNYADVEFDIEFPGGHSCNGFCKKYRGYHIEYRHLKFVNGCKVKFNKVDYKKLLESY